MYANAAIEAVPLNAERRSWKHRFPHSSVKQFIETGEILTGRLGLWYPRDPPKLRWAWPDGLDRYIRKVQAHLLAAAARHEPPTD